MASNQTIPSTVVGAMPSTDTNPLISGMMQQGRDPIRTTSETTNAVAPQKADLPVPTPHREERSETSSIMTMLEPFIGINIRYVPRRTASTFIPSGRMMMYIVHEMNKRLVTHFHFKREAPLYHPYVLRIYAGVLFYFQVLRARQSAGIATLEEQTFLDGVLKVYGPSSLPIPGPLLPVFKSLCASKPERAQYGPVAPRLPDHLGPVRASNGVVPDGSYLVLPQIPLIVAAMSDMIDKITGDAPAIIHAGRHNLAAANIQAAYNFGHVAVPAYAAEEPRSLEARWMLSSCGLEFPLESGRELNMSFAEASTNLEFPMYRAAQNLTRLHEFLGMEKSVAWFTSFVEVASKVAKYFEGSATLGDCCPEGPRVAQYVVLCPAQTDEAGNEIIPTVPIKAGDVDSRLPEDFRLKTSILQALPLEEQLACASQVNYIPHVSHPAVPDDVEAEWLKGQFWKIRPDEFSDFADEATSGVNLAVAKLLKTGRV